MDFKIGEVWDEITQEFKVQGVRPISPDLDCLMSVKETVQTKLETLVDCQNNLIEKEMQVIKQFTHRNMQMKREGFLILGRKILSRRNHQNAGPDTILGSKVYYRNAVNKAPILTFIFCLD